MAEHNIDFQNHNIHYHTYGNGTKVMLAFHGFGQNGSVFKTLSGTSDQYTIYSLDLFYHGKSIWKNDDQVLTKEFWKSFIEKFAELNDIKKFDVTGFSLGGKFALATAEAYPDRIEQIILIAPDGIKTNAWYSLATYPIIFKKIFKSMINKPSRFFSILYLMKKLGVIEKGISKFASSQMDTKEKRCRVYYSWITFSKLKFDLKKIAELINQNQISVSMYIGSHDKIITARGMQRLLKKLKDYKLIILDSGHNKLIENVAEHMIMIRKA